MQDIEIFTEVNHLFNSQDRFIKHLQECFNKNFKGVNRPATIEIQVGALSPTKTVIFDNQENPLFWVRSDEYTQWAHHFIGVDIDNIEKIDLAYVCGKLHPMLSESAWDRESKHLNNTDYYDAYLRIKYKS